MSFFNFESAPGAKYREYDSQHDDDDLFHFADIWLGATDASSEGIWRWLDGTTIPKPGHWDSGDISRDLVSANQHCMQFGCCNLQTDGWDDVECSSTLKYACQIDLANIV